MGDFSSRNFDILFWKLTDAASLQMGIFSEAVIMKWKNKNIGMIHQARQQAPVLHIYTKSYVKCQI